MFEAIQCLRTPDPDPLGHSVEQEYHATFYPMGYPVVISSNSTAPLRVATQLWSEYSPLSCTGTVHLRIFVDEIHPRPLAAPVPPRGEGHLISIVHGPRDFAIADLSRGFGFAVLSHSTIAEPGFYRYYFLEPLVYLMQAARHFVFVHASSIARNGNAIVLCGDSGVGKTCLAYACAKRGWSFVTGDALHIVRDAPDYTVVGRPFEIRFRESARNLFPELQTVSTEARPNRKSDVVVSTCGLGLSTELSARARSIVFIDRSGPVDLCPCEPEMALQQLSQTICFGDDEIRRAQVEALRRFVSLPIWRLNISNLDRAENVLSGLLRGQRTC